MIMVTGPLYLTSSFLAVLTKFCASKHKLSQNLRSMFEIWTYLKVEIISWSLSLLAVLRKMTFIWVTAYTDRWCIRSNQLIAANPTSLQTAEWFPPLNFRLFIKFHTAADLKDAIFHPALHLPRKGEHSASGAKHKETSIYLTLINLTYAIEFR